MNQSDENFSANVEAAQLTPAGLPLSVPADRARFCSTPSSGYVSHTIGHAASGTESDSLARS